MFKGLVILEDQTIMFNKTSLNEVTYSIHDQFTGKHTELKVDAINFFKALSLAVHPDGQSNVDDHDYAEEVMPEDRDLRWIP